MNTTKSCDKIPEIASPMLRATSLRAFRMHEIYNFFQEAIKHSRRENVMKEFLLSLDINNFRNYNFDEIFWYIWRKRPTGISKLGVYDITSKIYKHFGGKINIIYLVGNGPINNIKKLGLNNKIKKRKIKNLVLKYIEISDVLSIIKNKYNGDIEDGDSIESFLCIINKI